MNNEQDKYKAFGLVKDMLATPGIVAQFDCDQMMHAAAAIAEAGKQS